MSSGDTLLILSPLAAVVPATLNAQLKFVDGGSAPVEVYPCYGFDDTTQEYLDFPFLIMPQRYKGNGITVTLKWSAAQAATAVCEWQAAFRRLADDLETYSSAHTYVYNVNVATAPSVIDEIASDIITFTNGADMDSVVAGDFFNLRVSRDPAPSSGTDVVGDCNLHSVEISET